MKIAHSNTVVKSDVKILEIRNTKICHKQNA